MDALRTRVRRFIRSEDGPTGIEYAVMLGMIILAAVGSITTLGATVASRLVIPGW